MKNILVITPFFYPHIGGSQQYMEDIYACLVKKYPQIKVDVLCYKTVKESNEEYYRGMKIYRIPCFNVLTGQFCLPNPSSLINFILKNWKAYDLIHCSTRFFDSSWWAPVLARLTGKKIILTDHCAESPKHENQFIDFISKIIDRTIAGFFLRFYDKVYVTNKAAQKFLKQTFNIQSKVIYGGVNTEIFKPIDIQRHPGKLCEAERTQNLKRNGCRTILSTMSSIPNGQHDNERLKILYSGRMISSKGVLELFEIAKEITSADFIFAGPGPLVDVLRKKIERDNLCHIKIMGGLEKRGVAKLLSKSDIFVHPSFHHEGFPNALTEAGASRIAVIATDVGGSGEIIINGKTGILVKPKDIFALRRVISKLIKNRALRLELSKNLYEHILSNFTWEKTSEELYAEICRF